jgi:hypothetical protein
MLFLLMIATSPSPDCLDLKGQALLSVSIRQGYSCTFCIWPR